MGNQLEKKTNQKMVLWEKNRVEKLYKVRKKKRQKLVISGIKKEKMKM